MKTHWLGLAIMVMALSACQNGMVETPFGDYGVTSREGNRITIGLINKKIPKQPSTNAHNKPKIIMPQEFNGYWVSAGNPKYRNKVCQNSYQGDDSTSMTVDTKNNTIEIEYYEASQSMHWLTMQQQNSHQISGKMSILYQGEGDEEPVPEMLQTSMTLKSNGKELVLKTVGKQTYTTVYLRCMRKPNQSK